MKKSALALIFFTIFIDLLGFGLIIPILPFYAENYGATAFEVGLLGTIYSLMQFIFAPIWGRLSDQKGRRPLLILSLLGTAVGHFIFALAPNLTWLFIGRAFAGIATATIPVAMAYISDITTPENRAKGMGMIGAAFGLGFILGPAIGGLLSSYGYGMPLFFASLLSFSAAAIAIFKLPESLPAEKRGKVPARAFNMRNLWEAFLHPNIGILFTIFFLITLAFSNLETVFALFSERRFGFDATDNGYVFTMIGAISATVQGIMIGPLVKKFGEKKLISFSVLLLGIAFLLYPVTNAVWHFLPVVAMTSFALGIHNPTVLSLISKNTAPEQQGGILGINQSLGSLARVLGPLWGGYFFDAVDIGFPFLSAGILIMLVFLLTFRLYGKNLMQTNN